MASRSRTESSGCACVTLSILLALAAQYHGWNPYFWGVVSFLGFLVLFAIMLTVADTTDRREGRCPRCGAPIKQHTDEL
jgi:hypothetical protein